MAETTQSAELSTTSPDPTAGSNAARIPEAAAATIASQDEGAAATSDADSALGEDVASSTASLASSILQYRKIRGRTYHSEIGNAQYWGANDDRHSESLDMLSVVARHHLFLLSFDDKLYLAPVTNPKKVLDIGTGTGIWAIDVADTHAGCEVTGTDISPIQPTWVPPNAKFVIEDCTNEWSFASGEFDLVHIRYLMGCIPDWHALFREAYRCLRPGGYLESIEASPQVHSDDDTLPRDSAVAQWASLFVEGGRTMGRSFTVVDDNVQTAAMEAAGFVDIEERWIKVPSGSWPRDKKLKEMGVFSQAALLSDVEGFILFVTNVLGWTKEQVHVYIAHLRRELNSGQHHVYYKVRAVWGRKPEAAAS